MPVGVPLWKGDPAIDNDGTIPVSRTRVETRDLTSVRGLVDAQLAPRIVDVEQTSRYHRARAAVAVLPPLDELAALVRPGRRAARREWRRGPGTATCPRSSRYPKSKNSATSTH